MALERVRGVAVSGLLHKCAEAATPGTRVDRMVQRNVSWEHFDHGADVGIRGVGRTREGAFEQAALALANVVTDTAAVGARERVEVSVEAPDDELLLIDWLNALVFEMATRGILFGHFRATIAGTRLAGEAWGETYDPSRHDIAVEIKGPTHTALEVKQTADGHWRAQCVVDV